MKLVSALSQAGIDCTTFTRADRPGLPEEIQDNIFEPFVTDREQGAGLGLAIVKKVVEGHGGVVAAASEGPGQGATFVVKLGGSVITDKRGDRPRIRRKVLARPGAGSAKAYQLMMLGQAMVPMLQRFYLVIAILAQHGSGTLTRSRLERMCELSAERLSMIYGLHSPDFFNKTLFHDFIRKLQDQEVLRRNEEGLLEFDDDIFGIGTDARLVLGEQIRHSILSLTVPEEQGDE